MTPDRLAEKIRRGAPLPAPVDGLLRAASLVQRAGMRLRLRGPRFRVDVPVVSFGNITAGGTGKTPAVIERTALEIAQGHRVAVLTRGYGGRRVSEPLVFRGADSASPPDPGALGDEAAMIAARFPECCVVRARDRVAGARAAVAHGCTLLILDDGFQAVALERDENILLVDAGNPFGNGRILPAGTLREPLEAMARATHVVLTRCDEAADLSELLNTVRRHCPHTPIRMTRHAPEAFLPLDGGPPAATDWFRGEEIAAVCGVGRPESFFRTLEALGCRIARKTALPDHAPIPAELLRGRLPVVITEKDAARLGPAARGLEGVHALRMGLADFIP
ncbi:MAG TPA: tetraacyldisaccharide 4'-kinase [Candidatus Hydrogenedentes bacterium]|nr:tetraacyldisaccharide 4'-kinase [Candidatus Hydrogenedentota bacterium]